MVESENKKVERPKMPIKLPASEVEFEQMMSFVDDWQREAGVAVPARPIRAWLDISYSLGLGLTFPASPGPPRTSGFTGDDLSRRIICWFDDRYGDAKLAMPHNMCRCLVRLRGELWAFEPPWIMGSCVFEVDSGAARAIKEPVLGKTAPPRFNVLDGIANLPTGLCRLLTVAERQMLLQMALESWEIAEGLREVLAVGMMGEVISDIEQSVEHVLGRVVHFGQSRWSSLQAAEKAIKTAIEAGAGSYARSHDLTKLARGAESHGLKLPSQDLRLAQCEASARYTAEGSTPADAYQAHWASLRIVSKVCKHLPPVTR